MVRLFRKASRYPSMSGLRVLLSYAAPMTDPFRARARRRSMRVRRFQAGVGRDRHPAVPPARANPGFWEDEHARGNTPWHSDNRNVNEITGYKPVEYKDGYPVLEPYTQETVYLKEMLGDERDFIPCDRELAKRHGKFKGDGTPNQRWAENYRKTNQFTWHHHQDGARMQMVHFDLHSNIPHAGGASAARTASGTEEGI